MDTGQISLMPANVDMQTPGGVQPSSLATLLSGQEGQTGVPFAGLLDGMTPSKTSQGATPVSVGKGVPSSDSNVETAPATAVQDGVSGVMAGWLNALDTADKPLATGTGKSSEVTAAANRSGRKPQDVVLNADGFGLALLTQVNDGRMPQTDLSAMQQAVTGSNNTPASAPEGSADASATADTFENKPQDVVLNADGLQMALLTQVNGGRMPQTDLSGMQQAVTASNADTPIASLSNNGGVPDIVASTNRSDGGGGLNPSDSQLDPNRPAFVEPQNLVVDTGAASTERGTASNNQNGSVSSTVAPVSGTPGTGRGGTDVGATTSSEVEFTAQSKQEAPLFRSASLDVALAESVTRNEVSITGQTQIGSSAQNTPVAGIPAASTEKTTQTVLQQDIRPVLSGQTPVRVTLSPASSQQPDQTATSNNSALQTTWSVQAAVESAAEQTGMQAISPESGKASTDGQGSVSGTSAPAFAAVGSEFRATASSEVEVTAQAQQAVPLFRSASLEVALAESVSRNEIRSAGQGQDGLSAQDAPAAEIPAASLAKSVQTEPRQEVQSSKSGVIPVQAALTPASLQEPDQTVPANYHTLEGSRAAQAAVVLAAGKTGVEAGGESVQTPSDSTAAAKPVQSMTVDAVKFAGSGSSGGEFSSGDDKGTADNFMSGQFHATLMHQQGNAPGTSVAGNVSAPVQNDVQQSGLSEQILQQVKDRLVNHDLKAGNDQIVLRLSPENLGDLKLNLSMDGQRLKVEIVAENHMVRDALMQNTDSLKESLARQNIRMESFDVTTSDRGAGNAEQGKQQNDWRGLAQQKQQNIWMSSGGYRLPGATAAPTQLAYQTPSQHAMVDLHF